MDLSTQTPCEGGRRKVQVQKAKWVSSDMSASYKQGKSELVYGNERTIL